MMLPACTGGADVGAESTTESDDEGIDPSDGNDDPGNTTTSSGSDGEDDTSSQDPGDDDPSSDDEDEDEDPGNEDSETPWDLPVFDLEIPEGDTHPVGCPKLEATIRDFRRAHADFEVYEGDVESKGLVEMMLGPDRKPVHVGEGPTGQTSGRANFNQWYNDVPMVNQAFDVTLELVETGMDGLCTYDNQFFFPIDGKGFGDEGSMDEKVKLRNFHFTTEIHTEFVYRRGQIFRFTDDDDLWMFVDGKLVIDLGGLHPARSAEFKMDTLGPVSGSEHTMDIFHAERHTNQSTFRIDTNIGSMPTSI